MFQNSSKKHFTGTKKNRPPLSHSQIHVGMFQKGSVFVATTTECKHNVVIIVRVAK